MARKHANAGSVEEAAERRVKALELRKAGLPYRVIAEECGVSEQQAWRDVKKGLANLAKMEQQAATEVRQLELERIDTLLSVLWTRARGRRITHDDKTVEEIAPDMAALDRVMRLMERRAKLLGLDLQREEQVDHEVTIRVVYGGTES